MCKHSSIWLAIGGLLSMAAALGIGRFVYTPILPVMLDSLNWSKSEAGLVASSNFLGYLIGALAAARRSVPGPRRIWLLAALLISALTKMGMALQALMPIFIALRFVGGAASAFVIVFASTLVLERLSAAKHGHLSAIHFGGVGVGIMVSAAAVSAMLAAPERAGKPCGSGLAQSRSLLPHSLPCSSRSKNRPDHQPLLRVTAHQ